MIVISRAHINSKLQLARRIIPTDENTVSVWHFDNHLYSSRGIKPIGTSIVTMRHDGYFGGAVAVEEATTNLIPENQLKFEGWAAYQGAIATITQGQIDPLGGKTATRIQTTGGTNSIKYFCTAGTASPGDVYQNSVWVRALSGPVKVMSTFRFNSVVVYPSDGWVYCCPQSDAATESAWAIQLQFRPLAVEDSLDFLAWRPQIEKKAFATSFVNGSRPAGKLHLPASILNVSEGTINCWVYVNPSGPHSAATSWAMAFSIAETVQNPYGEINQISLRKFHNSDQWRFVADDGTGLESQINLGTPSLGWHMFTVTWNKSTTTLCGYLDGELKQKVSTAYLPDTFDNVADGAFHVGGWIGTSCPLNSMIDELRIDKVARSDNEVREWYNAQAPFYDPMDTTSIAY